MFVNGSFGNSVVWFSKCLVIFGLEKYLVILEILEINVWYCSTYVKR
jgi:hypothetical protein